MSNEDLESIDPLGRNQEKIILEQGMKLTEKDNLIHKLEDQNALLGQSLKRNIQGAIEDRKKRKTLHELMTLKDKRIKTQTEALKRYSAEKKILFHFMGIMLVKLISKKDDEIPKVVPKKYDY